MCEIAKMGLFRELRSHLEPFLDFTVPIADQAGWTANDHALRYGLATKQVVA